MRSFMLMLASLGAIAASAASAQTMTTTKTPAAMAAERYGMKASYTGPQLDVGYSRSERHIADCLATYPRYDPKTDLIRLRSGETRRCRLPEPETPARDPAGAPVD